MTSTQREERGRMVNHVGDDIEEVRFIGGPLDGRVRYFRPQMMSTVYRYTTPDQESWYRLRRIANPVRTGRGWIDLQFVYDESSTR